LKSPHHDDATHLKYKNDGENNSENEESKRERLRTQKKSMKTLPAEVSK
jgi:hypothetical protein